MFGAAPAVAPGLSVAWVADRRRSTTGSPTGCACDVDSSPWSTPVAVGKADMPLNDATPDIAIDPDTFAVRIDGELVTERPAEVLPMAQRYFLF